jgi:hypothetical protein
VNFRHDRLTKNDKSEIFITFRFRNVGLMTFASNSKSADLGKLCQFLTQSSKVQNFNFEVENFKKFSQLEAPTCRALLSYLCFTQHTWFYKFLKTLFFFEIFNFLKFLTWELCLISKLGTLGNCVDFEFGNGRNSPKSEISMWHRVAKSKISTFNLEIFKTFWELEKLAQSGRV